MTQPYQQRVIDEKEELDSRLAKLSIFLDSDTFETLVDPTERFRLKKQARIMREYSDILAERIAHFA